MECAKCGKTFSRKYDLKRLVNRKTSCVKLEANLEEVDLFSMECAKCGRAFLKQYDLIRHVNRKTSCLQLEDNLKEVVKQPVMSPEATREEKVRIALATY